MAHGEGGELVAAAPGPPSRRRGEGGGVRDEAVGTEATEEPHHGQGRTAVTAVGGGVDQPVLPPAPTRRLPAHRSPWRRGGSAGPPSSASRSATSPRSRQASGGRAWPSRARRARGEAVPAYASAQVGRAGSFGRPRLPVVRGGPPARSNGHPRGAGQPGRPRSDPGVGPGGPVDPPEHEGRRIVEHGEHLRHGHGPRLPQPGEACGPGHEEPGGVAVVFANTAPAPVGEVHSGKAWPHHRRAPGSAPTSSSRVCPPRTASCSARAPCPRHGGDGTGSGLRGGPVTKFPNHAHRNATVAAACSPRSVESAPCPSRPKSSPPPTSC